MSWTIEQGGDCEYDAFGASCAAALDFGDVTLAWAESDRGVAEASVGLAMYREFDAGVATTVVADFARAALGSKARQWIESHLDEAIKDDAFEGNVAGVHLILGVLAAGDVGEVSLQVRPIE